MEKLKSFFISLLLFIGFSAIGITVGYFIGTAYADLKGEGKFSNWRKLDDDLKFVEIVDATSQTVWAKTFDGAIFSWDTNCAREPNCNQWVQANEVPGDVQKYGGQSMERGSVCPPTNLKYYSDPPGNTVECVLAITYGMDIMHFLTKEKSGHGNIAIQ
ncbi:MAG TPA: hypothetical protein VLA72_20995 [Anaerolineales bacterium]|nr:hypothetical protein [Anaerolineales bacterium]